MDFTDPRMIAAQLVGFVALAGGIITYSQQDDQRLKQYSIVQGGVITLHFILLGTYVAAGAAFISAVRNYFSTRNDSKKLVPLFLLCYLLIGYARYQVWYDILPMIGSICSTIGLFYLRSVPMRLTFLTSTSLWLTHNILAGSIGPSLMEGFIWAANARTIWRLRRHKAVNAPLPAAEI